MPGDCILGINCDKNASTSGGPPPDPLPGLCPGPDAFIIFRQLYLALHPGLDILILALNHGFRISCGGVPIWEDAGMLSVCRSRFVLFSPVFSISPASYTNRQGGRCIAAINSPPYVINKRIASSQGFLPYMFPAISRL